LYFIVEFGNLPSMEMTSISIPVELRDAVNVEASKLGMKQYGLLQAIWRGWQLLTDQQKHAAMTGASTSPATE